MDRLRGRRECVREIIRQEYGQTAGGNAKNETSFRVAGNDGLQKIELFEECFQEPGHVHGIKLTAVESAPGVSPRAAHRTGREPLDSSGSCHQFEGYRLPSKYEGSSCCQLARFGRW